MYVQLWCQNLPLVPEKPPEEEDRVPEDEPEPEDDEVSRLTLVTVVWV